MWWAIVTLRTIGYGDVVPVTALGRVVASVTIFLGLIMVALPIGIVATAFAEEIHRRDFVVTWGMVARVPLFAELQATDIADIMRLLRAQQVEAGDVIARRGEPAHSMYFIAAGEVEIELKHERVRLGAGHFFGEIAALRRTRRSATVTAVMRTSLFVLDAHDLHVLMDREPRIAERIHEVARTRLGGEVVTPKGDLVAEELAEAETPRPSVGSHSVSRFVPQCDSMQQTGLLARSSRVTPPKIHSPNRLCPYPPATIRSALSSSTIWKSSAATSCRGRRQISAATITRWRTR
jgi:voltage-gated potassium channel